MHENGAASGANGRFATPAAAPSHHGLIYRTGAKLLRDPSAVWALGVLIILVFLAASASFIAPYSPFEVGMEPFASPSVEHLFGTDQLGRDVFSRMLFGAQISLSVSSLSACGALFVGVPLGLLAGYRGGKADTLVTSIFDVIFAFPAILLGITLVAVLGSGISNVVLAVAVINVPTVGRLTRVSVITQTRLEYVEAARALGASALRVATRHILPNIVPPLLVQTTVIMGTAVLLEAGFSFLGLGSRPPTPSWGSMLDSGRAFLAQSPWLGVFPGAAISVMVLALNAFSDALRRALDSRQI